MGKKLDEYKSIGALATTMTKNFCIDMLRKRQHLFKEEQEGKELQISGSASPFEIMDSRESENILYQIIDQLPEIYKECIRLREIDGLSYDEIAEKTEQNINTLRVTLSRARKVIREEFNKYQYERRSTKEVDRKVL